MPPKDRISLTEVLGCIDYVFCVYKFGSKWYIYSFFSQHICYTKKGEKGNYSWNSPLEDRREKQSIELVSGTYGLQKAQPNMCPVVVSALWWWVWLLLILLRGRNSFLCWACGPIQKGGIGDIPFWKLLQMLISLLQKIICQVLHFFRQYDLFNLNKLLASLHSVKFKVRTVVLWI